MEEFNFINKSRLAFAIRHCLSSSLIALLLTPQSVCAVPSIQERENRCIGQAYALRDQGQFKAALALVSKFLRENPNNIHVLSMRSGLYCQMGDYNKALQDANRMLKLDPKSPFAYHDLGLVYKEVAKPKEAIVAFTKALELSVTKDGKASNYYHRGSQYASIGEYQKCIDDSTRSLEIGGRRVDSLAQRAISIRRSISMPRPWMTSPPLFKMHSKQTI